MENPDEPRMPEIRSRTVVHRNPFYEVHKVVADFGSYEKHYYTQEHGTRVGIVLTRGHEVLLVKQYRFLAGRVSLEVPGGGVLKGESPEAAAVRECVEETGLLCRDLRLLLHYQVGLDVINNPTYVFHSGNFDQIEQARFDSREVEGQAWVPIKDCLAMVSSGQIADSFSIVALFAFHLYGRGQL